MRDVPPIEAIYTDLANSLDARLEDARSRDDVAAVSRIEKQQSIRDAAYFVLERFPIELNNSIDKKSLSFQDIRGCSYRKSLSTFSEHALAWRQLEARINDDCIKAIARRKNNPNWEVRRAWDAHNENDPRTRFEDRVALLLDRNNVARTAYRDTIKLYGLRNLVAHGKSAATGIDVTAIISQLYQIASEMKT